MKQVLLSLLMGAFIFPLMAMDTNAEDVPAAEEKSSKTQPRSRFIFQTEKEAAIEDFIQILNYGTIDQLANELRNNEYITSHVLDIAFLCSVIKNDYKAASLLYNDKRCKKLCGKAGPALSHAIKHKNALLVKLCVARIKQSKKLEEIEIELILQGARSGNKEILVEMKEVLKKQKLIKQERIRQERLKREKEAKLAKQASEANATSPDEQPTCTIS